MDDTLRGLFGPNTGLVDSFLVRLARASHHDLRRALDRWHETLEAAGGTPWARAEDATARAIAESDRRRAHELAADRLGDLAHHAGWFRPVPPPAAAPLPEACVEYVAASALTALLVRDRLSPEDFSTLYAPFAEVIPFDRLHDAA